MVSSVLQSTSWSTYLTWNVKSLYVNEAEVTCYPSWVWIGFTWQYCTCFRLDSTLDSTEVRSLLSNLDAGRTTWSMVFCVWWHYRIWWWASFGIHYIWSSMSLWSISQPISWSLASPAQCSCPLTILTAQCPRQSRHWYLPLVLDGMVWISYPVHSFISSFWIWCFDW